MQSQESDATFAVPTARLNATLAAICGLDGMAYALVLPILPFLLFDMGAPTVAIGLVFLAFSACQMVAAPMLGRASGRWGRRPVLAFCLIGSVIGFVVLALARVWPVLALARALDGATAGSQAVVNATVCDAAPEREWTGRFASLNTASGAGALVGLLLCGLFVVADFWIGALIAAALTVVSLILTVTTRFPSRRKEATIASGRASTVSLLRLDGPLRRAVSAMVAGQLLLGACFTALPFFLQSAAGLSIRSGVLVTAAAIAVGGGIQMVAARRLAAWADERIASRAFLLVIPGAALLALSSLVQASAFLVLATLSVLIVVVALLLALSASTALVGRSDPSRDVAELMGISQSAAALGQLVGPAAAFIAISIDKPLFCLLLIVAAALGAWSSGQWFVVPVTSLEPADIT